MHTRPFSVLFIFLLWSLLIFLAPTSVYWRDSGEFILTAFYLDVPHTPGFPVYATLSNIFALLPFGPIAFRVHTLSAASACIVALMLALLCKRLTGSKVGVLPFSAYMLLSSAAYLRGALTAEVYLLACVFSLALLYLYICYRRGGSEDLRLLLTCAFLSGLATGVHVSTLPLSLIGALLILSEWNKTKRIIVPSAILFIVGCFVFFYLPVRAHTSPPLNSGAVYNATRLGYFLTNRRDTDLRQEGMADIGGLGDSSVTTYFEGISKDLDKIKAEISLPLLIAGLAGLLLLFVRDTRVALLILGSGVTNYLFFKGWEADPWIPFISVIILGLWMLTHPLFKRSLSAILVGITLVYCCFPLQKRAVEHAIHLSRFLTPVNTQKLLLSSVPAKSLLITEPSWFLTRYAQDIEGMYDEVPTGYLHELLFPAYFSSLELRNVDMEQVFSSLTVAPDNQTRPYLQNVSHLVKETGSIFFEPSEVINTPLQGILTVQENGLLLLKKDSLKSNFAAYQKQYEELFSIFKDMNDSDIRKDSYNYLEARLAGAAQLLSLKERNNEAATLLLRICAPLENSPCTLSTLNNAGVYLMRSERYRDAVLLYSQLKAQSVRHRSVINKNLQIAREHLLNKSKNILTK